MSPFNQNHAVRTTSLSLIHVNLIADHVSGGPFLPLTIFTSPKDARDTFYSNLVVIVPRSSHSSNYFFSLSRHEPFNKDKRDHKHEHSTRERPWSSERDVLNLHLTLVCSIMHILSFFRNYFFCYEETAGLSIPIYFQIYKLLNTWALYKLFQSSNCVESCSRA